MGVGFGSYFMSCGDPWKTCSFFGESGRQFGNVMVF